MKKLVLILLLIPGVFYAQDISITTSAGFAGYGNPVDGYYVSFNLATPIIKGIDIAPNFTFMSNAKYNNMNYYWHKTNEHFIIYENRTKGSKMATLMEMHVVLKPFQLINSKSTIDMGISTGYGISIYSENYYNFKVDQLIGVILKNGIRNSLSVRLFYNYHFSKNYFIGISAGAHDFIRGEGASTIGVQFGITP